MSGRIKLPGYQSGSQAAKGGTNFVSSGGKPFTHQAKNPGFGAGDFRWNFQVVDAAILPAFFLRLVGINIEENEAYPIYLPLFSFARSPLLK